MIAQSTRMKTMEEKMKLQLADESLDDIVGGAFNQQAVSRLDLAVKTGTSGAQGLSGTLTYLESSGSSQSVTKRNGPISENSLRTYMGKPGELSVEVKTTSGKPITLGRNEIKELLS
jgi:hypothetical protein